jgi:hypothetical protein
MVPIVNKKRTRRRTTHPPTHPPTHQPPTHPPTQEEYDFPLFYTFSLFRALICVCTALRLVCLYCLCLSCLGALL